MASSGRTLPDRLPSFLIEHELISRQTLYFRLI
jgi:hypothetical protein